MTIQKFSRRGRMILAAFTILAFISAVPVFSQGQGGKRQLVDTSLPLEWTRGYTLILLDHLVQIGRVINSLDFPRNGTYLLYAGQSRILGAADKTPRRG